MKHNILTSSDLWAKCTVCGKKITLRQEILAQQKGEYIPFKDEECDPNMKYVYPVNNAMQLAFVKSEPSELEQAFNDLMEAYPDGSAR